MTARSPSSRTRPPVYAPWQREIGPVLSLGMLTAAARTHADGSLDRALDIHRPELADEVLADLGERDGPAVLLCSDYVWSLEHNLDVARRALALCPQLIVIHGGPSAPKYPGDAEAFLRNHGDVAHILVRGEGEQAVCELLDALVAHDLGIDPGTLASIPGITFRDPATGEIVRTPDRERLSSLDDLPSPYLTGEFDHIDPAAWHFCVSIETNRGCPYGCTFCDWGSATLARIRSFPMERIAAELAWSAARGIFGVQICDANFGIMKRDVETASIIAGLRRQHDAPAVVAFTPAKNTTKHLTRIFDELLDAGILLSTAISLQTTDPTTLDLVARSNISTESYLALAADLRRRGQALQGDLLIGMPGQTYESYRTDLQFFMDHEIEPRTWNLRLLPNAPMNDPAYRERHQVATNRNMLVVATESMSEHDRLRMRRLRKIQVIAWKYGTLRHLMNVLQWDHGIAATTVLDAIAATTAATPTRYPVLSWVFEYFDLYQTTAISWAAFYDDVRRFLRDDLGVEIGPDLEAVIAYQLAVLPAPGRALPAQVDLAHDYPSYLDAARRALYDTGRAATPPDRLADRPPARITVTGDPQELCSQGLQLTGDPRSEMIEGSFWIDIGFSYELPVVAASPSPVSDEPAA